MFCPIAALMLLLAACPLFAFSGQVPVTFRVDMSYQITEGNFDPERNYVDIAGTFNGWGAEADLLTDADGDSVYSVTIEGFVPSTTIEFKFRIDGAWDGREEFSGGGPNRVYTIKQDSNIVHVWYNDELPPTGPPLANFSASATSVYQNGTVLFHNNSGGLVTEWKWIFDGGEPRISKNRDPVVYYGQPGSWDVTLIASHEELADTLVIRDMIHVRERKEVETHWWNDAVFYELFVRSFYDSSGDGIGDFRGIIEKLDYLNDGDPSSKNDLGITGIWLMPIHESPSYHGYDVTDYRSVNSDFGTMDDFREFLREAHKRSIRVIIDFVLNHSSRDHPWFRKSASGDPVYRDYYRWKDQHPGYGGPWGSNHNVWHRNPLPGRSDYYYGIFWSGMPDINFDHQPVKDSLFAAADFWLREIGVDGFRLDAVLYIHEDGEQLQHVPKTLDFWHDFNRQVKQSNPDAFTVGEAWTGTDQILPYVTEDRIDYAFEFNLAESILSAVQSGDTRHLRRQMQRVYDSYPYQQFATFLTNHDQNRVMSVLNQNTDQAKMAAAIYLTLPGVPYLYYGEEIGMTGTKPDPEIRTPMQWSSDQNAGFTNAAPWIRVNNNYRTVNVAAQENDPESLLNWYRKLIRLRSGHPSLRTGSYRHVQASDNGVFSFLRKKDDEKMLILINTGSRHVDELDLSLPGLSLEQGQTIYHNLIADEKTLVYITDDKRITDLSLQPHQAKILALSHTTPTNADPVEVSGQSFRLDQNYPNPFNPATNIRFYLPHQTDIRLEVYDLLGQKVALILNESMKAGEHRVSFDGSRLASGLYVYRLLSADYQITRKMILLK